MIAHVLKPGSDTIYEVETSSLSESFNSGQFIVVAATKQQVIDYIKNRHIKGEIVSNKTGQVWEHLPLACQLVKKIKGEYQYKMKMPKSKTCFVVSKNKC